MTHCGRQAAYVVRDAEGAEAFICAECAAAADVLGRADHITPIAEWFRMRAMVVQRAPVCSQARAVDGAGKEWIVFQTRVRLS